MFLCFGPDQYRYQTHTRWNCPILKYLRSTISYRNHIVSSNIFQIIWPKICKSQRWISGFIGFLYIEWAGEPVTKVFWWLMKMKILWMLVVIVSQPASCCTASVLNLPPNISLRYFDWFLSVDHPDYKVLHHILDQCSSSYTRYKWTSITTETKEIQIKILRKIFQNSKHPLWHRHSW